MKSFLSGLKNWMSEGKYAVVSRSRSVCSPRTPSLFKDKSQLSFPSLASLICLCMLTVGVGDVWG